MPSNTAWARPIGTTIINHLREEEIAILRATRLGAMIESRGRVTTDLSGLGIDWRVQYRIHPVTATSGALPPNFTPQNLWKVPTLETRGYQVTDAIVKVEFLQNRGPQAIVRVFEKFIPRLITSLKQQFGREYYADGNAIGNENRLHGIETFTSAGVSSGTYTTLNLNAADNVSRTGNNEDLVAWPTASYCGLSTVLGTYGGSWSVAPTASATTPASAQSISSHWPNGDVDPEYDFWTPLLINYISGSFNGSSANFKSQGLEAMRFGLVECERNMPGDGESSEGIDVVLLHRQMLKDVLVNLDANQRTVVTNETGLRAFGFKHVFEFDGAEVSTEYYIPNGVGYGFNVGGMELLSMQKSIFDAQGPEFDINTQAYKVIADFYGNLKFNSPRNFFKLGAFF